MSPSETATPTVSKSNGQLWLQAEVDPLLAADLARSAQLPLLIAELLVARGISTSHDAAEFLHPNVDQLSDPYAMSGMLAAVNRLQQAIREKETILIYGDYDVDGTTAIVLLKTALEMLGGSVRFHIPHRLKDGYGMQGSVLETAFQENIRLVVSVDTGMRAFAEAETAKRLGLDLIITDHHLPDAQEQVPNALAVLNPNQPGCNYPCKHLCGAGVAFKLAQALLEGYEPERKKKILASFLKMLAIATVADAVPLLGENRIIAAIGLEELKRPMAAGLRALMQVAQLDPQKKRLTATDVAFRLAPRINAAGRMDVASDVVELFTTRDHGRAIDLANKLDRLNTERRETELASLQEIEKKLEDNVELREARCIVVDGEGWHRGVIGILASRVVDRWARPTLVITYEGEEAHGSGRSVPGFHLLEALESCAEVFTRFGGHAHAVGFRLPAAKVPELRRRLNEYAEAQSEGEAPSVILECHGELPLDRITPNLFQWLRKLEPVGIGNPEPIFIARQVQVVAAPRILKERHVKLQVAQGARSASFAALGWNWAERVETMGINSGSRIDLAYRLRENEHPEFGGLELEIASMQLTDTADAEE